MKKKEEDNRKDKCHFRGGPGKFTEHYEEPPHFPNEIRGLPHNSFVCVLIDEISFQLWMETVLMLKIFVVVLCYLSFVLEYNNMLLNTFQTILCFSKMAFSVKIGPFYLT